MSRLTTNIREALLKKLLKRAFGGQVQDLMERQSKFAVRLYEDALGKKDLALVNSLPKGWLPEDDDFKVQIAGTVQGIYLNGTLNGYSIPSEFRDAGAECARIYLPFPNSKKQQVMKVYEAGHPLAEEFQAFCNETTDLKEKIGRAARTAKSAMESVTTVKKLIEVWPEVEEFAKDYLHDGERKAVLPMIPRTELNAALNLPPEEKEAA